MSASRIVLIVGCGNVGKSVFSYLIYNGLSSFGNNPSVPKFFAESIAEIVMFFHVYFYITDRIVVFFQTNSVRIRLRLRIF